MALHSIFLASHLGSDDDIQGEWSHVRKNFQWRLHACVCVCDEVKLLFRTRQTA